MLLGPVVTYRDGRDTFDLAAAIKSSVEARIVRDDAVDAFHGCRDMLLDGRLRLSVTKMAGRTYRVAIHVADGTIVTAGELQAAFGAIAASLGFGGCVGVARNDDRKVGYLGIADGEVVCAADFDFAEGK